MNAQAHSPRMMPAPAQLSRRLAGIYVSSQFARFILFGGTAAAVNLGVGDMLYTMHGVISLPYYAAVACGGTAGLLVNFALNYRFNFRYRGRPAFDQLRTFGIIAAIGVALTSLISAALHRLLMFLAVPSLKLPLPGSVSTEFTCHFLAVGLVTFYSFAAHRAFSFNAGIRHRFAIAIAGRASSFRS